LELTGGVGLRSRTSGGHWGNGDRRGNQHGGGRCGQGASEHAGTSFGGLERVHAASFR
jgi:hypothetical protein